MNFRSNEIAPDFLANTSHGKINFHEWIGNDAVISSSPSNTNRGQAFTKCTVNCLPANGIIERIKDMARTLESWRLRHKTRMQFANVEARILRDVGISEGQRFIEVNKPFWEQ
jgi:uncharacterized protein YjiS (DUF1127 family)